MFICFTGIDGSGKSTLAKALVTKLELRGIKSKYVYGRFQPLMLSLVNFIGRVLFLHGKDIFKDYIEYSHTKKALFGNRLLSSIYGLLLLFDYFFQIIFKIWLPIMLGKNIICDRYIYDTIVTDLAVDLNYSQKKIERMLKTCLSFFPKPDLVFLVDVPEEIAYYRKNDVPSINYLKDRRRIYLDMGHKCGMKILDGLKELVELETAILSEVNQGIK